MACDRNGCDRVCCDYISDDYGYLCRQCFEAMCETVEPNPESIREFMRKDFSVHDSEAREAYFKAIFHNRWEDE